MIYDKVRTGRMLRVVLEVCEGALDLAARPGGEPSLRTPAIDIEKKMRNHASKGDGDAMYDEYLRVLQTGPVLGEILERLHHKSMESEFYRFVKLYWERD